MWKRPLNFITLSVFAEFECFNILNEILSDLLYDNEAEVDITHEVFTDLEMLAVTFYLPLLQINQVMGPCQQSWKGNRNVLDHLSIQTTQGFTSNLVDTFIEWLPRRH